MPNHSISKLSPSITTSEIFRGDKDGIPNELSPKMNSENYYGRAEYFISAIKENVKRIYLAST